MKTIQIAHKVSSKVNLTGNTVRGKLDPVVGHGSPPHAWGIRVLDAVISATLK